MGRAEKSIEIRAPPENVWEMLAWDRFPEWDEGTQKKRGRAWNYTSEVHTPADKYRVGASCCMKTKQGGPEYGDHGESVNTRKLAYRVSGAIGRADLSYILKPVETGTKLSLAVDYEMPWGIFGKILDKLYAGRAAEKEFERSLEQLKNLLEK